MEEWRIIEENDNYSISNLGRVKNNLTGEFRLIQNPIGTRLYYYVNLSKNGKVKKYNIHRLLAQAFIPNPNNLPLVDHIDRNKINNNLDNLRWCSHSDNQRNRNLKGTIRKRILKDGTEKYDARMRILENGMLGEKSKRFLTREEAQAQLDRWRIEYPRN